MLKVNSIFSKIVKLNPWMGIIFKVAVRLQSKTFHGNVAAKKKSKCWHRKIIVDKLQFFFNSPSLSFKPRYLKHWITSLNKKVKNRENRENRATNSNFVITISLQPHYVNLLYFKLRLVHLLELVVWNI